MQARLLILGVSLAVISLLAGWWRADLSASEVPFNNDKWDALAGTIDPTHYSKIAENLQGSDIFPISRAEATRLEQQAGVETKVIEGVPPFPSIVGASVLNGVPHIHLLLTDKSLLKAKSGDELESGWELISVDLKRVNAVYDEEEHEFSVTNYDVKPAGGEN